MFKKLDKLIVKAFLGPFIATFSVLVFIFLIQFIMKYIDELLGKDLGFEVYGELFFYFALFMFPQAMPLAILLASLITYGSLGEHNELAAIKSVGISLVRILRPIFAFVVLLSLALFWFNDKILPEASLRAFSLLYDIRTKKVALDIKPKVFYYGLPGFTVKVEGKGEVNKEILKGVMIYDHTDGRGNTKVIMADSGLMHTMYNDKYLVLELYHGKNFSEVAEGNPTSQEYVINNFENSRLVFNLSSFDLNRTDIDLFKNNRMTRNLSQLTVDLDSFIRQKEIIKTTFQKSIFFYSNYEGKADTIKKHKQFKLNIATIKDSAFATSAKKSSVLSTATNQARSFKSFVESTAQREKDMQHEINIWSVEIWKRYTSPVSCIVLFLIGAPLGSIIRKGGLGVPVLVGLIFFIIYYVLITTGEKNAKESVWLIPFGMWLGNTVLFIMGVFFLRQAYNDASLFEIDFYVSKFQRLFGIKTKVLPTKVVNSLADINPEDLK